MPRTIPSGLLTSATRCTAIEITLKGGTKYGYTNSTVPFTFSGVTYQSLVGASPSAIQQESGTTIDNMELTAVLNDTANLITSEGLLGGKFEDSRWRVLWIDFMNPGNGAAVMAAYRLAKMTVSDTSLKLELVALLSYLRQATGRTYCAQCDVLTFGDKRCDPGQTIRAAGTFARTVGAIQSIWQTDFFGDSHADDFYSAGDGTWSSGANSGMFIPIKKHVHLTPAAWSSSPTYGAGDYATSGGSTYYSLQAGNHNHTPASSPTWWLAVTGNPTDIARITWRTPPSYSVAVGDQAALCRGCDRRRPTCQSIANANEASGTNVENFQGFYLPDPDQVLIVGR